LRNCIFLAETPKILQTALIIPVKVVY